MSANHKQPAALMCAAATAAAHIQCPKLPLLRCDGATLSALLPLLPQLPPLQPSCGLLGCLGVRTCDICRRSKAYVSTRQLPGMSVMGRLLRTRHVAVKTTFPVTQAR
jgi:hypothetical protein